MLKAGEEIKSLARFTSTQRTAFRKLLKKYKKWTGSVQLEERFRLEVLDDPKSFTKHDLGPLLDEYSETLHNIRTLFETKMQMSRNRTPNVEGPVTGSSVPARLHSSLLSGSRTEFDTALATVPLSEDGAFASFFVHPENVVELQVLLLQHLRYYLTRSRSNSVATPVSPLPRSDNPTSAQGLNSDFFVLAADSPDRFIQEQSAVTVDQREHTAGSTAQRTKICARWNAGDDEASLATISGQADTSTINLKQKHLESFFDTSRPFLPRRSSVPAEISKLNKIRESLSKDKTRSLYQMSCCRSRLLGFNNTTDNILMATLDTDISFKSAQDSTDSTTSKFPFAVLQVREDGSPEPALIKTLNKSHLVERVRGFSMEYHAIWQLCRPQNVAAPFWIPTLSRDIRKLPPPAAKRTISTSHSPSATLGSGSNSNNSVVGATDSTTAVDTPRHSSLTFEDHDRERKLQAPPLRSFRKKRRRGYPRENEPVRQSEQPRYWSEYDHPEDGSDGGGDAYVLYIDPNEKSSIEVFFDKIASIFSRRGKTDQLESTLPSPSTPGDDETSDEEDDEVDPLMRSHRSQQREGRGYGTLPLHTLDQQLQSQQQQSKESAEFLLLPHFAATTLIASLVILIIGYLLATTGKRKLVKEVDAGVILAVISSLIFAVLGFGSLLRRSDVGWLSWTVAASVLIVDAVGNAGLLAWMLG